MTRRRASLASSRRASFTLAFHNFLESLNEEAGPNERAASSPQLMEKEVIKSYQKVGVSDGRAERLSIEEKGEEKKDGKDGPARSPEKENEEANSGARSATSLMLTEEEHQDNKKWQIRFLNKVVFTKKYYPTWWEMKEMDSIVEFLALKNPADHPEYLNEDEEQVTKSAIESIFFPTPEEGKSVLLKRGPVRLGGEERELMLFTHGFVLSRVETDSLLHMLLDDSPEGPVQQLTAENIGERFKDIDADMDGSIDRSEIQDFFRGMGMMLSETILDNLMEKLDSDHDGTITLDEFKSAFLELRNQADEAKNPRSSWNRLLRSLSKLEEDHDEENGDVRRLDVAFQWCDIETIDTIVGEELIPSALAVYPKGESISLMPLMVACAKPGHVDAWGEAFLKCMQMEEVYGSEREKSLFSRIDWG